MNEPIDTVPVNEQPTNTNPTLEYLNPATWFPSPRLDNVLVLLPSYSGPGLAARAFLDELVACGANIVASYSVSDIALHRCIVAGRAMRALKSDERLSRQTEYVLWLDDDMVATASHVAMLRASCAALAGRGVAAAVTGVYCKRGNSGQITLRQMFHEQPRVIDFCGDGDSGYCRFEAWPVLCGMGCMMMRREVFVRHCEQAPQFAKSKDGLSYPAITASGPCFDEAEEIGWLSEDQCYGQGLWTYADGVFAVPIAFAHLSLIPLIPRPDAIWLQERPTSPTIPSPPLAPDEAG